MRLETRTIADAGLIGERTFDLLLADGRTVQWVGRDGVDASQRYADCKRETVVAWRNPRVEIAVGIPETDS